MVVEAYMGQPFDYSHEKEAADYLLNEMQSRFHSRPESYFLLANVLVDGSQLDFIILKPKGVIVVELKEVADPFIATENGEWSSEGRVISTSGQTPYQQVRNYRQKLIDYLGRNLNLITQKTDVMLRQVSSFVCISPRIHQDSKVLFNFSAIPFFKIVGLDQFTSLVDSHISPGLTFNDQEYRKIIKLLGLKPMKESYLSDQFFVPYRRNELFTGRNADLSKLHDLLSSEENKGKPTVISGFGGLGKTQLCVEYAYQFRSHYPNGVFWVNASENLISQFAKIAEGLELRVDVNLPGNQDDILARRFLKMISGTPDALLIFDNIGDFTVFYKPLLNEFSIISFKCHLLFTSRDFPYRSLDFNHLKLKPFPAGDAQDYVSKILKVNALVSDAVQPRAKEKTLYQVSKLCGLLGYHPLALNFAANSISQRDIDLTGYIQRLQVEGRIKTLDFYELNNYDTFINYSINEMLDSHWDGFNKFDKYILCFFTFFSDEEVIPEERLRRFLQRDQDVPPGYPDVFNDALISLVNLGLVQKIGFDQIRIHPLYKEFCASKLDIVQEEKTLILQNLASKYSSPSKLETLVFTSGVVEVKEDLRICKSLLTSESDHGSYSIIEELYQIIVQDTKFIIDVRPEDPPGLVKQQIRNRAFRLQYPNIASLYEADLTIRKTPWLCETYNNQKLSVGFIQEYIHDNSPVRSIKLTGDGRLLVSGSSSGWICVWDVDSGKLVDDVKTTFDIESIQLSPNGEFAAVRQITGAIFGGSDGYTLTSNPNIEIWSLRDHKKLFFKPEDANEVYAVLDDRILLFGTDNGEMLVCDYLENDKTKRVLYQSSRIVNIKVSFSKIAVVHENSVISIIQKSDLKLLNTCVGPVRVYKDAAFLDNDQVLVGCFENYYDFCITDFQFNADKYDGSAIGSAVFWDTSDGEKIDEWHLTSEIDENILRLKSEISQRNLDDAEVTWYKFILPKFVASSDDDCCLVKCGPSFYLINKQKAEVMEINMPDSKCFGVLRSGDSFYGFDYEAGKDDPLCVLLADAKTYHPLIGHLSGINDILASKDEKYLFSASDDGTIKMWEIGAFREECVALEGVYKLTGREDGKDDFGKITSFIISRDEKKVAAVTQDGYLIVYSSISGDLLLSETKMDDNNDLQITSYCESGLIILHDGYNSVITYDINTNEKLKYQITGFGLVNCIHDYQKRLVGLRDARQTIQPICEEFDIDTLRPWYKVVDVEKNEVIYEVDSLYADILDSDSGGYLISNEKPGKIYVFDLVSLKLLNELSSNRCCDQEVVQFQMNKSGTYLSVTFSSGVKEVFNLSTGTCELSHNYDPAINWSFDDHFKFVSINANNAAYIWNLHNGKVLAKILGYQQIQMAGSGRFLVSLDSFGILHFYDCINFY